MKVIQDLASWDIRKPDGEDADIEDESNDGEESGHDNRLSVLVIDREEDEVGKGISQNGEGKNQDKAVKGETSIDWVFGHLPCRSRRSGCLGHALVDQESKRIEGAHDEHGGHLHKENRDDSRQDDVFLTDRKQSRIEKVVALLSFVSPKEENWVTGKDVDERNPKWINWDKDHEREKNDEEIAHRVHR